MKTPTKNISKIPKLETVVWISIIALVIGIISAPKIATAINNPYKSPPSADIAPYAIQFKENTSYRDLYKYSILTNNYTLDKDMGWDWIDINSYWAWENKERNLFSSNFLNIGYAWEYHNETLTLNYGLVTITNREGNKSAS